MANRAAPPLPNTPIVDSEGMPTHQFQIWWLQLLRNLGVVEGDITDLETSVALKADKTITISAGTGLTGGGDLSANRTLALDETYTAELIRDTIGSALVAGSNITITVNDVGDTITIAAAPGYTDEQVRDVIGAALVAGTGITITVNDVADTITITSTVTQYTDEMARDAIGTALTAGAGITVTPNDGADTITVASTITQYTDEMARDALGLALTAGTGITITVNDPSDTITVASSLLGVTDGDKGDVTISGTGTVYTVDNDVITNAKAANMATQTFKGRTTAGTGDPEDLTIAQAKTLLDLTGTNSGDQTITLTSDVTGSGTGSFATTVANNAITNVKAADMATQTFKGRTTAGTGDPEDLTVAQAKTMLSLTGTNSGDQTITLTGDVTGSGTGSFAATIANDAVTYAKMQNFTANKKLLGRVTSGAGDPEEISIGTGISLTGSTLNRDSFTGGDISASTGSAILTIINNTVTYAKMQDVSAGDMLIGRITGAGDPEEIACTAAGRALIDDADATAQRTTLGLGTAAVAATGASGHTLPFLDVANTFSGAITLTGATSGDATLSAQYTGASGTGPSARFDTYTVSTPSGANHRLGTYFFSADNPSTGKNSASSIIAKSIAAWTATDNGSYFQFNAVPAGSVTTAEIGRFTGGVGLLVAGSILSNSATLGVGYSTGAGGTVTQITSKATGVTLNKVSGQIVSHNAALAAAAVVSFVVTNTTVAATDTINLNLQSGNTTAGTYRYWIDKVSAGSFVIAIENRSAGSLGEALTFNFAIIKSVTS